MFATVYPRRVSKGEVSAGRVRVSVSNDVTVAVVPTQTSYATSHLTVVMAPARGRPQLTAL
jgi:hypothetical protein